MKLGTESLKLNNIKLTIVVKPIKINLDERKQRRVRILKALLKEADA